MKQTYLTISEFAGLRNVSIGSLRYYEQLGILHPARIDPQTKYRYYLPEQLGALDAILLCVALDIPLKELKEYVDTDGCLNEEQIFVQGKQRIESKIAEMQTKLEMTQFSLNSIKNNQQYHDCAGIYVREIGERFFLEAPFSQAGTDASAEERISVQLFREAQEKGMAPVFPSGIIIHCEEPKMRFSHYIQVLHPDRQDERIVCLPKARYNCLQADLTLQTDVRSLLEQHFRSYNGKMIIISNMLLGKLHYGTRHSEIQLPADE